MNVYIVSSDQFLRMAGAKILLLNKYWPGQDIKLLCYKLPDFELPDNVEVISMGIQGPWSEGLVNYFEQQCTDTYFTLGLDDIVPIAPVDQAKVDILEREVREGHADKAIMQNYFFEKGQTTPYREGVREGLCLVKQDVAYRCMLQECIWTRDYFLMHLTRGETAWQLELNHGNKDGKTIICLADMENLFKPVNIYRQGKMRWTTPHPISDEDRELLMAVHEEMVRRGEVAA